MTTVLATANRTMNPKPGLIEILPRVTNTQMGTHAMTVSQSVGNTTLLRKVRIVPDSQTGGPASGAEENRAATKREYKQAGRHRAQKTTGRPPGHSTTRRRANR